MRQTKTLDDIENFIYENEHLDAIYLENYIKLLYDQALRFGMPKLIDSYEL